jgi:hypothetical protein
MYENIKKTYYESIFNVTQIEENLHMIAYSLLAFLVPFFLGHPQVVVGVAVNAALILGVTYIKGHKMLPIILLPSLGVLARGLIFGPFTVFLIYMIPFIWLGNAVFAYGYKYLAIRFTEGSANKNKMINKAIMNKAINSSASIALPAILKTAFLFTTALVLVKLSVLPIIFLTTMGILQLGTTLIGGLVAISIIKMKALTAKKQEF